MYNLDEKTPILVELLISGVTATFPPGASVAAAARAIMHFRGTDTRTFV
jgi:hypothetical protein